MTGIVICHKSLAHELLQTARAIVGHQNDLYAFSNDKITGEQLVKKIEEFLVSQNNPEDVVLMVDLRGGNCWSVARMVTRLHPGHYVLSGVNLPMLFSFLTKKDRLPFEALIKTMEEDAHRGIILDK